MTIAVARRVRDRAAVARPGRSSVPIVIGPPVLFAQHDAVRAPAVTSTFEKFAPAALIVMPSMSTPVLPLVVSVVAWSPKRSACRRPSPGTPSRRRRRSSTSSSPAKLMSAPVLFVSVMRVDLPSCRPSGRRRTGSCRPCCWRRKCPVLAAFATSVMSPLSVTVASSPSPAESTPADPCRDS